MIIVVVIAVGIALSTLLLLRPKDMSYKQTIFKILYPLTMWGTRSNGQKNSLVNTSKTAPLRSFYLLTTKDIEGRDFSFGTLKGKKILLVNTASDCGYTAQLESLEQLSKKFSEKLVVIGFPANDFKDQETGDDKSIANFCRKNYGVSFPLMSKSVVVNSSKQNSVYQWLTNKSLNGWCAQAPAWNFCKYLINEEGILTHYFPMSIDPMSSELIQAIEH